MSPSDESTPDPLVVTIDANKVAGTDMVSADRDSQPMEWASEHPHHGHAPENGYTQRRLEVLRDELEAAQRRYHDLFENAAIGFLILNERGVIERASSRALDILSHNNDSLAGQPLHKICTPESQAALEGHLRRLMSGHQQDRCEVKIIGRGGRPMHVSIETCHVEHVDEGPLRAALLDLTELRIAEARLALAASVVEHTSEGVMITDAERRIIAVNPAFSSITGYTAQEMLGKSPRVLQEQMGDNEHYRRIREQLATTGHWQGEIWNRRKNDEQYLEWLSINEVRDESGALTNYVGLFSDVSQKHQMRKQLFDLAYYDSLTGLANRHYFLDQLSSALFTAVREISLVGLVSIDLDHFKDINDSLGHRVGDQLLRFVARLLRDCVRKSDIVARIGGDEFTLILVQLATTADAARIANKILRAFEAIPFTHEGQEYFISSSMGIAMFPDDASDAEGLLRCADMAMYRAKESGRKGYALYAAGMANQSDERLKLETELRQAVSNNELSLLFQPQIRLSDGQIIGCEALLRWKNDASGRISPQNFIPLAEESGMIVPLGHWVLNEALKQIHQWGPYLDEDFRVAINVSGTQLNEMHANRLFHRLLEAPKQDRRRLELELAESVLLNQPDQLSETLARAKLYGLRITIDDFGTSYSSANLLKRLPIDRIKIDMSFVQDVGTDSGDASIASALIMMGRALGIRTTAEGVETVEQLAFLIKQGCDEAQGYLFSAPIAADAMTQHLLNPQRSWLPDGMSPWGYRPFSTARRIVRAALHRLRPD